jgi:hypothetical protein
MNSAQQSFLSTLRNSLKFFLFKLTKLPSLAFWGVKLGKLDESSCQIKMKLGWSNKNPFGSLYFSALAGAGELSTGLPVLLAAQGNGDFSMLVVGSTASFTKKAKGTVTFSFDGVEEVLQKLANLKLDESSQFTLTSIGRDESNDIIGEFSYHWSIKKRK